MVNTFPFEESQLEPNNYLRKFSSTISEDDLLWHWDEEDRIIECVGNTDWQFQFDNCLPQPIRQKIVIPRGTWHRLIKGTGDLIVLVEKIYKGKNR